MLHTFYTPIGEGLSRIGACVQFLGLNLLCPVSKYWKLQQRYFDIWVHFKVILAVPGISAHVSVRDESSFMLLAASNAHRCTLPSNPGCAPSAAAIRN